MRNFTKGLLVGIGVGLLFAPLTGEELRQVLNQRFNEFRNSLPEDSRLNHYAHQMSDRVEQTKGNLRGYAQQTVIRAKDTGSTLSNKALHSGQDVANKALHSGQDAANKAMHSGQDIAQKAKQTSQDILHRAKQTSQDVAQKAKSTASSALPGGSSTNTMPESAKAKPRE